MENESTTREEIRQKILRKAFVNVVDSRYAKCKTWCQQLGLPYNEELVRQFIVQLNYRPDTLILALILMKIYREEQEEQPYKYNTMYFNRALEIWQNFFKENTTNFVVKMATCIWLHLNSGGTTY